MGKAKADENDDTTARDGDDGDADDQETSDSESDVEITPVKKKIGESKDNLRKRSDYFQKRRS